MLRFLRAPYKRGENPQRERRNGMEEMIVWCICSAVLSGAAGFGAGWRVGRGRLRKKLSENSVAGCFLKLLNY